MFEDKKITFIGPGMMAQAMISGIVRNKVAPAENLLVSGPRQERVDELHERYGVQPFTNNAEAAALADIVILSVKPQRLEKVMEGIAGKVKPDALVLSILAGVPIKKIKKGLDAPAIVRAMPNTPARIGQGITVWTTSAGVSDEQKELARQILTALGQEVFVEEEDYLDKATALSGTGSGLCLPVHGGDGGCRGTPGLFSPDRRAAGGGDGARVGQLLRPAR